MKRTPLALLTLLLVLPGCGTEHQRTTYPIELAVVPITAENHHGWSIEFEEAWASVGTIRFQEGSALFARRMPNMLWSLVGGTAHAHPGHYHPGDAMGEWLDAAIVDLLSESPTTLGIAEAITGHYGSMELHLPPPRAGLDAEGVLRGHSIRLVGNASRDGEEVPFEALLDLDAAIEGIPFSHAMEAEPGRVRITLRLPRWLDRVDFSTIEVPAGGGRAVFSAGSQARNAFHRGVTDTGAYLVEWVPGGNE